MSMFCVYCDHDNRSERDFCAQCGASLVAACKQCNFRNYENEDYCGGCGAWVRPGLKHRSFKLLAGEATQKHNTAAPQPDVLRSPPVSGLASTGSGDKSDTDSESPSDASTDGASESASDSGTDFESESNSESESESESESKTGDTYSASQPLRAELSDNSPEHQPELFNSDTVVNNTADSSETDATDESFALYCELLDTDALVHSVDAESWRRITRSFQRSCSSVIDHFDGHLARITSQGIVAYFGYPALDSRSKDGRAGDRSHAGNAQTAVKAAFELVAIVGQLHESFHRLKLEPLTVQVTVVAKKERGDTSNHISRTVGKLMQLARPGNVIVDDKTYRACKTLVISHSGSVSSGPNTVTGSEPGNRWHSVCARNVSINPVSEGVRNETPLFGRDRESQVLKRAWLDAQRGFGQVVLIRGRDGIGKSRLATENNAFTDPNNLHHHDNTLQFSFNCHPSCQAEPLAPFVNGIRYFVDRHNRNHDRVRKALLKCSSQSPMMASVLNQLFGDIAETEDVEKNPTAETADKADKAELNGNIRNSPGSAQTPHVLRLGALQSLFERMADQNPLTIRLEDAHWIDQSSLELLTRLIVTIRTHPILLIITSREELPARWHTHDHVQQIRLTPLDAVAGGHMISCLAAQYGGGELTADQRKRILSRADGVPLFLQELCRAVSLQSPFAQDSGSVPDTLRDAVHAHLGEPSLRREIALCASIIGIEFDLNLLQSICDQSETVVQRGVNQLVDHGIIYSLSDCVNRYRFQHTLVQESAYEAVQPSHRTGLHRATAQALVRRAETTTVSNRLIGWHFERAGEMKLAADFYEKAALASYHECTFHEMTILAEKCLNCLKLDTATAHTQGREARLMVLLGAAHRSIYGIASETVSETFRRALQLSEKSAKSDIWLDATGELFASYIARGELRAANLLSDKTRRLFDNGDLIHGAEVVGYLEGVSSFWSGRFSDAHTAFSSARDELDKFGSSDSTHLLSERSDLQANVLGLLSWTQWITGEPDRAVGTAQIALDRAHENGQPFSMASTYFCIAATNICSGNIRHAEQLIHRTGELAKMNGIDYLRAVFTVIQGQVASMSGDRENGLVLMSQGVEQMNDCEAGIGYPWVLSLVASAYLKSGYVDPAHDTVIEAIRRTELNDEYHWIADLYRLKGQICIKSGETEEGRRWLHRAFETARSQGARALELRTLLNISKLRESEGPGEQTIIQPNRSADIKH